MTFLTFSIQETLERKIEFCEHLLSMAAKLCPGASEMHGLYTTVYKRPLNSQSDIEAQSDLEFT